jgi:2'-5' RNA ligase
VTETAATGQRTTNHWWWRPGWGIGTRCHTVHITFQDQPALHAHAAAWRKILAPFDQLDPVPDPWLHLTMQGLGLRGEINEDDVAAIGERAAGRLAEMDAFDIVIDRPRFTPEATRWDPRPAGPIARIRNEVRAAIGEIWSTVPEDADDFTPHITIGYGNRDADAAPILEAVAAADIPPLTLRITHADLILLGRDEGRYTWESTRSLPLRV